MAMYLSLYSRAVYDISAAFDTLDHYILLILNRAISIGIMHRQVSSMVPVFSFRCIGPYIWFKEHFLGYWPMIV